MSSVSCKDIIDRRVKIGEFRLRDHDHEIMIARMSVIKWINGMFFLLGTLELTTGLIKSSFSSMIDDTN